MIRSLMLSYHCQALRSEDLSIRMKRSLLSGFPQSCQKMVVIMPLILLGSGPGTGTFLLFPQLCHSCGGCFRVCPHDALEENPTYVGQVQTCQLSDSLRLVTGRLKEGDVRTTAIIRKVREMISDLSSKKFPLRGILFP